MAASTVLYERDGRIARITLNRPEKLNPINDAMPRELSAAVAEATRDEAVHVVILTGAGRAFCAGYDPQPLFGWGLSHETAPRRT